MAKITAPVKGFEGKVVGVRFIDGIGEATEAHQIAYFERQGYTVEGGAAPAAKGSADGGPSQKDLQEQARALGLPIGGSKAELTKRIAEAQAAAAADAQAKLDAEAKAAADADAEKTAADAAAAAGDSGSVRTV